MKIFTLYIIIILIVKCAGNNVNNANNAFNVNENKVISAIFLILFLFDHGVNQIESFP